MFQGFIVALKERNIAYVLLNGYEDIVAETNDSDIDILLPKKDFLSINKLLNEICCAKGWKVIQVFHHDVYAKNIFLFSEQSQEILNLDIYGFLSRLNVPLFTEDEIFQKAILFNNFKILSKEQEFIYYLIKKLDKNELTKEKFDYLKSIFLNSNEECGFLLKEYFPKTHLLIEESFRKGNMNLLIRKQVIEDFSKGNSVNLKYKIKNVLRFIKRIYKPTGLVVAFLGSDGSGKSTIIELLKSSNLPFRKFQYFHLKPIKPKQTNSIVSDPHKQPIYSPLKSYFKLLYLIVQYNLGWLKNILPLKIKSTLIVFDRYYDDLLVDPKRFRYGGGILIAKWVNKLIPKPDIVFVLTASPEIIYRRKQEVKIDELIRQIKAYNSLANKKDYHIIDVNRSPIKITYEVIRAMIDKMNSRYN